jgi:1-deoxy-D-xylulose-5-phosphate reductoisomerase
MVEFTDGSTVLQASPPDMRLPIALGLGWPDRVPAAAQPCDWSTSATWTFEPLDDDAFPAVRLARTSGARGGVAPAVFNAANEECVAAFRAGRLGFLRILEVVEEVLELLAPEQPNPGALRNRLTLADVLSAEQSARTVAQALIEEETA